MKRTAIAGRTVVGPIVLFIAGGCGVDKPGAPQTDSVDQAPIEPLAPMLTERAGNRPDGESAGNNLSYPVVWAEGIAKTLRGTPGVAPMLQGVWWYWWGTAGTDPNVVPLSCPPDPDDPVRCDDGAVPGEGYPAEDLVRAYVQKDDLNEWQAQSWPASGVAPANPVVVDLVDWGDNLESVDWYLTSHVRAEVVLFEDAFAGDFEENPWPMLEYGMRHTSGWGIDEVHGLAVSTSEPLGPESFGGERATVYSHCARFTIQKLLVPRGDTDLALLEWEPGQGWTAPEEQDLVNPPIFNLPVYEGGDGPGYYSAEINVKGRIIYGHTWNVRRNNEGPGDYRLTFSFDQSCGAVSLNTFFFENVTELLVPIEEVEEGDDGGDTGGATGVLVPAVFDGDELVGGNFTYVDVRIHERDGGKGDGGKRF